MGCQFIEYESSSGGKTLSVEECLNKIRPYLKDIKNNIEKTDTWTFKLTIRNNFISFMDNDEERVMHSKSDNMEITINDDADEVIKKLFHFLKI